MAANWMEHEVWVVRSRRMLWMFENRPVWSGGDEKLAAGVVTPAYVCLGACSVEMRSLQEVCDSSLS